MNAAPIACFGKLPGHGDFIRLGAASAGLQAFDQWQQEGIHRRQQQLGPAFAESFDALPDRAFLWRDESGTAGLFGFWRASRDRAGRRYPFIIAQEIAPSADLPTRGATFLRAARGFADAHAAVEGGVAALREAFDAWAGGPASQHAAADAAARPRLSAAPAQVLEYLRRALQPGLPPRYLLRLDAPDPAHVAFWLRLAVAWNRGGGLPVLTVWSPDGPGRVGLLFDRLDGRYFASFFWSADDDQHAFDLDRTPLRGDELDRAEAVFGPLLTRAVDLDELYGLLQSAEVR